MIEKNLHQIWIGDKSISDFPILKKLSEDAQRFNISWQYKLWTNNDIKSILDFFSPKIQDEFFFFYEKKQWALAADILRLCIIYIHGGVYMDVDFAFKKSLDYLCCLSTHNAFFVNMKNNGKFRIQNCVFGCSKKHTLIQTLINFIETPTYHTTTVCGNRYIKIYGVQLLTTELYKLAYPNFKGPLNSFKEDISQFIQPNICILPKKCFFGSDAIFAKHIYMLSHHEKNKHKYQNGNN